MIQPILFNQLVNWSVQYLLKSKVKYNQEYDLVNIGDFLTRNKTAVSIEDHKYYKRVTIKVRNGGVFLRDTEIGKNIGTKNQFLIKKGQFLLSKIDARNGAFGVVPEEVNGAIITGNFWTFDVDYSKINPHFLALITTTPEFISFCENASNGTTNRHYLQESSFLEQLIPLPPLEEQNSLVSSYKGKLALAIDQIRRAKELEHSIENYLFEVLKITKARANRRGKGLTIIKFHSLNLWGADKLLRGGNNSLLFSNKYANKKISEIADVNPRTDITKLKDSDQMSFIPMECVSDDFGEVIELRAGIKQTSKGYTKFQEGDLIWARITPCMQNGKSAIVKNLKNGFGYGSTEFHVIRNSKNNIDLEYLYHILRLNIVLQDAVNHFTGSAGQQRVPKSYLENLMIPVPPLRIQKEVSKNLFEIKEEIKKLNTQAEKNKQEALVEFEKQIFEQ